MSDCRLTTFDNPYDPFEQFALWMLFDNRNGYNTCGKIDRLTHYSDDMSEKEFDDEHERVIDEIIDNDFLNIYKKSVQKSKEYRSKYHRGGLIGVKDIEGGVSKITPPPYIAPVFENSPGDIFQKTFG